MRSGSGGGGGGVDPGRWQCGPSPLSDDNRNKRDV